MKTANWTIQEIEDIGFNLITNHKLWCHFRGQGFDVFINLDTREVDGNIFNFKSYKSSLRGNFKAKINNKKEFDTLLNLIL